MLPPDEQSTITPPRDPEIAVLARAVRRLTVAVWCLVALFGVTTLLPWASFLWYARKSAPPAADVPRGEAPSVPDITSEFDNDFHARPPEEKIRRATVILLAQNRPADGMHKAFISEVVKQAPGVRFYYKVGDEYPTLSHAPSPECNGCESEGEVIFLIGNPAQMASAYSYRNGRIDGMGGLSLAQLRELAVPAR